MLDRAASVLRIRKPALGCGLLLGSGTTVPSDGATGWATGAVFAHTDGGAGTAMYVNEGTTASADFNPVETPGTLNIADLADVGATVYTAGKILVADGNSYEEVAVSGDATLASSGALTIATGAVEDSMIEGLAAGAMIVGVDGTAANNAKVTMSGDATMAGTGAVSIARPFGAPATVAATGSTQGDAAALAAGFSLVSAGDATKGVKLPAASAGKVCIVKNGVNAVLKVWANTDDAINAIAANGSLDMAALTSCMLIAYDATTWYSVSLLPS